jgi:4-amino-4-deoxy-L-arabinose transferase-like glycosyltransferase
MKKTLLGKFKYELLVVLFFVLLRLPGLGSDTFNTDVWKWKARSYDFGTGIFTLDLEKTIQKYHPGVTLMWLGTAGIKIYNVYHETFLSGISIDSLQAIFGLHTVQKVLVVVCTGITLAFVFYVLRKLFGSYYAFLAIGLLSVEPFYVGLTRTFHLEGLLSTYMLASAVWFYYYLEKTQNRKHLLVSSLFASLAFLTKTSALYLVPFYGLILILNAYRNEKMPVKNLWKTMLVATSTAIPVFLRWLIPTLLLCFILWPAFWTHAGVALGVLYRGIFTIGVERGHEQYFFGKLVNNPGIFYYDVVFLLRSSVYLVVGMVGVLLTFQKLNKEEKSFSTYLLIFSIVYGLAMAIPSKKLDRYLLPTIVGLIPVVTFFYLHKLEKLKSKTVTKYLAKHLVFFSLAAITMLYLHPDYLSYYNPMFGGLRTGIRVIEPKWILGGPQIVDYFNDVKARENLAAVPEGKSLEDLIEDQSIDTVLSVGFPEKYYTQIWPFVENIEGRAVIKDLTPFAKHTKYFVYPVWSDDSSEDTRFKLESMEPIKVRGVSVYNVYKRL